MSGTVPINIEQFEMAANLDPPATSDRILLFLLATPDQAFTRRELADAVDAAPETVGTNLTRLKNRDLVRHHEPYWAIVENRTRVVERLRDRAVDVATDELTDRAGWEESMAGSDARAPETGVNDSGDRGTSRRYDDDQATRPAPPHEHGAHRAAAAAFADRTRARLGDAVDALYLFGSVASGAATPASDVDVLVVVANDADYAAVDDQLLEVAYDVQLQYDVPIEVHALQASEFSARRERGDPFVRTVLAAGETLG